MIAESAQQHVIPEVVIPSSLNYPQPSLELLGNLQYMAIADVLTGFIAPERVRRWGFLEVERFAAEHGYRFIREGGNLYGRLMLVPIEPTAPTPALRLITRSDHAAVYGKKAA